MAKVTRKKLARGVKLTVSHVFDPIGKKAGAALTGGMADEIEESNIDLTQRVEAFNSFRVNFSVPWLDSKYFFDNATVDPGAGTTSGTQPSTETRTFDKPFYIPFCLPPLQQDFDSTRPAVQEGQPVSILDEIGLSFDQSDEAATLVSQWYGKREGELTSSTTPALPTPNTANGYQYRFVDAATSTSEASPEYRVPCPHLGKKSFERLDAYDFRIEIYEKEQTYWSDLSSVDFAHEFIKRRGQVVDAAFPPALFSATSSRLNPVTVSGINRQLSPYKTYIMALFAPKLHDSDTTRRMHALVPSLNVSLRFTQRMYSRDTTASDSVQNMPPHGGAKAGPSLASSISIPATGDLLKADSSADGISSNLEVVDRQFQQKLRGGYQDFSMSYPTEELKEDAGYEVVTVPLGQGFSTNRMSMRDEYPWAPYVQTGVVPAGKGRGDYNEGGFYFDRRLVPLPHEMTIHHVILALNTTSDMLPTPYLTRTPAHTEIANSGATSYIAATHPTSGFLNYEVGVGLVTGIPGDNFEYQQVAYARHGSHKDIDPALAAQIIDAVDMELPSCSMNWEYKLVSVPLMGSNNGNGYWQDYDAATPIAGTKGSQGRPIWAGEGNSFTGGRSAIIGMTNDSPVTTAAGFGFNPGGGVPNATTGAEQYLEVRLAVKTTAAATNPVYEDTGDTTGFISFNSQQSFTAGGLSVGGKAAIIANQWHHGDIALGYGGCWVYIIGKKHLK
tara:strand:- start:12257 stop:14440 length:2184 start_codon:yes stop_codon:yes gene_type:complete